LGKTAILTHLTVRLAAFFHALLHFLRQFHAFPAAGSPPRDGAQTPEAATSFQQNRRTPDLAPLRRVTGIPAD
jgi:hypothetical protein